MSSIFLPAASRDKRWPIEKKPSFPISTNRDENRPLKRMVITTWPIMMIISNFEKKESNVGNW